MIFYYKSIILFLCFLTIYFNLNISYSESPTFVRQEIDDSINDLLNSSDMLVSSEELEKCNFFNSPSVDINGVSIISDTKFLNATVWLKDPFQSFINSNFISSEFTSNSNYRPNLTYQISIINSSLNISTFIKKFIDDLRHSEEINSIELIPMKAEEGKNFKIIFNINKLNTKYILFFTVQNNIKYLHSFNLPNDETIYKKYLPIINKIINSTEFIQYNSNTTYANYENPYFGIKLQYPIELFKNFHIESYPEIINEPHYTKWQPIFSIYNKDYTNDFQLLTKNKTEDYSLEDFKREMIAIYLGDNIKDLINYTHNLRDL